MALGIWWRDLHHSSSNNCFNRSCRIFRRRCVALYQYGIQALDKYASMTEEDVLRLNPETINSFDRPVAYYNPANFESAQKTSDVLLDVALVTPVFLLLDKKIRKDWKDILSLFLVAHAVDNVIYFSSGTAVRRPRPLTYNPAVPLSEKAGEGKSNSFFSG